MFDGGDLDAADRRVDGWQADLEKQAAQVKNLSERLSRLMGSARSDDGLVEVSVGPSGAVTDLWLEEGIRRQSAARTAREILATVSAAQAALAELASEAVAETVGADTETGRAILASFTPRLAGRVPDDDV